ncbi:MAG: 50S ribosomal protein L17 [Bacteroidetes bacterium]|nr:50S ribosomal protein L17 [Bacteroidota bacterium]
MRHGNKINHLGRTYSHRKALLKNLAAALLIQKRITTTLAKAKELRVFVEPIITKSKTNTTHSRRIAFGYLQSKTAIKELFDVVSPKVGDRPGGYTRIVRIGNRFGDNAEMVIMELVDFNELYQTTTKTTDAKAKKSRRAGAKVKAEKAVVVEDKKEEVLEEKALDIENEVETPTEDVNTDDKAAE